MQSALPIIYQAGNTFRTNCTFRNKEDIKVDPETVLIIFSNHKYEVIDSFFLTEKNRKDVGEYFFDYTLPNEESLITYEWRGITQNDISFQRKAIEVRFL